eukprot:6182888-Pleurochrysis_carterae.AAC.1
MVTDRLFQLQQADSGPGSSPKAGRGAWRRGNGCARLQLPTGAHHKGKLATMLSMVADVVQVEYSEPMRWRAMPTITLRYFVLTMDSNGHVNWSANFASKTKKFLRQKYFILL